MTTTNSTRTGRIAELGQELGHHLTNLAHSLKIMVHEARTKGDRPAQGHLTLTFPMKSSADGAAVRDQFPALVAELSRAADAIGTLHYCRLIALDDGTVSCSPISMAISTPSLPTYPSISARSWIRCSRT